MRDHILPVAEVNPDVLSESFFNDELRRIVWPGSTTPVDQPHPTLIAIWKHFSSIQDMNTGVVVANHANVFAHLADL